MKKKSLANAVANDESFFFVVEHYLPIITIILRYKTCGLYN